MGRGAGFFEKKSLGEIIATVIKNLEVVIREKSVEISVDPLPDVICDKILMERLLQNLIANGIKFIPKDRSPVIHISCRDEKSQWVVVVTDNGIGIPENRREMVFQIFKRLHSTDQYEGTGIGLAVCKKIAEAHRGRIWFESLEGLGTEFFFSIDKNLKITNKDSGNGKDA